MAGVNRIHLTETNIITQSILPVVTSSLIVINGAKNESVTNFPVHYKLSVLQSRIGKTTL